jgi:hypothetical protein
LENQSEILKLETLLNSYQDAEMSQELEKFRHYELVNNEKITPEFLKLAKISNNDHSLKEIRDDKGNPFPNDTLRNAHIVKHGFPLQGNCC